MHECSIASECAKFIPESEQPALAPVDSLSVGSITDPYESCPECGDDMAMKTQPRDGLIGDGDDVICPSCGYKTALSVDEEGNSWLQQ